MDPGEAVFVNLMSQAALEERFPYLLAKKSKKISILPIH
ncbi:MAG: hypothetical protein ACI9XC_002414 [Gammaproteobacteria bacterium]|jgi:hypothetical protein